MALPMLGSLSKHYTMFEFPIPEKMFSTRNESDILLKTVFLIGKLSKFLSRFVAKISQKSPQNRRARFKGCEAELFIGAEALKIIGNTTHTARCHIGTQNMTSAQKFISR